MATILGANERQSAIPAGTVRRIGVAALGVALAALWVASAFTAVPFPVATLAETIIRLTPGAVATFFIDTLGSWALRLLSFGVLVGALAAGGELLWRTRSGEGPRPWRAAAFMAVVGAVLEVPNAPTLGRAMIAALSLAGAAGLFAWTATAIARSYTAEADPGRRQTLRLGLLGAVGIATAGGFLGWFARSFSGPDRNVALAAPSRRAVIPQRAPFPDVPGLSEEITSAADHYVVDIDLVSPSVEAGPWELTVDGLVDRPLTLGFDELQQLFDVVEEYSVLTCVSNEVGGNLVGNSLWGGVRLADVLDAAGASADAVDVIFRAADDYSDSIPIEVARDPHVILAVSQNRRPLTQDHGFPCRVRVPIIYGMKNVKWLTGIEVVGNDYEGYWQTRGWSDEAVVKTQCRIDVAGDSVSARVGQETWIAGVAWAGDRGISRVEVSTDDGRTWERAMLKEPLSPVAWTLWAFRWTPERSGSVEIHARATDGEGRVQAARYTEPHPAGASGYPRRFVEVT